MIHIVKYVIVVLILAHVGRICGFIISPTPTKHAVFERSTQRFSTLQDISNTTKGIEDPTIRKYSRWLSSQDQISEELPSQTRWKSMVKKRIKTMKRVIKRPKKNHGTLILVRGGETEYAGGNQRFTGWSDPPLTKEGVQQVCFYLFLWSTLYDCVLYFLFLNWPSCCLDGTCGEVSSIVLSMLFSGVSVDFNFTYNPLDFC